MELLGSPGVRHEPSAVCRQQFFEHDLFQTTVLISTKLSLVSRRPSLINTYNFMLHFRIIHYAFSQVKRWSIWLYTQSFMLNFMIIDCENRLSLGNRRLIFVKAYDFFSIAYQHFDCAHRLSLVIRRPIFVQSYIAFFKGFQHFIVNTV